MEQHINFNAAMMNTIGCEFTLTFSEEHEDGLFSGLEFTLDKIEILSTKHVVFSGNGSVNNASPEKMYIRYTFNPRKNSYHFDRVRYYANGTIRHMHPLELDCTNSPEDIRNVNDWNKLLKMITDSIQAADCKNTKQAIPSNKISIESGVREKLQGLALGFIERDKANQHYSVAFVLEEIVAAQPNSVILKGMLSICGKGDEKGYIEYKSVISRTPTHFSRIRYYKNGSIRRINPLIPDPQYSQDFETLYQAIQSISESVKS